MKAGLEVLVQVHIHHRRRLLARGNAGVILDESHLRQQDTSASVASMLGGSTKPKWLKRRGSQNIGRLQVRTASEKPRAGAPIKGGDDAHHRPRTARVGCLLRGHHEPQSVARPKEGTTTLMSAFSTKGNTFTNYIAEAPLATVRSSHAGNRSSKKCCR